jgi:hypothetical protein
VTNGPSPSLLFYPLNSNEPWVNEPFCVEMLGGLDEEILKFGPNPCSETLTLEGTHLTYYSIIDSMGKEVQSGYTDSEGRIKTNEIKNGLYLIKTKKGSFKVLVNHLN